MIYLNKMYDNETFTDAELNCLKQKIQGNKTLKMQMFKWINEMRTK